MLFLNRKTQAPELSLAAQFANPLADQGAWGEDSYRPSSSTQGAQVIDPALPRRACGSLECAGGRPSRFRNRKRPIFEGQWGCSGRCVLAMVRASVRRQASGLNDVPAPHRHRVPLGLVLLAQGWITHAQLQLALERQRAEGGRIGEWLVSECGVEAQKIVRGVSMQWACPVLGASGFLPREMALVMPRVFVEEYGVLPLRVAGSKILYLGFEERLDAQAAFALEQMTNLKVESGLVPTEEYRAARASLLEQDGVEVKSESVTDPEALAARVTAILEQRQPAASKLVRVHRYFWLRLWLENGAKGSKAVQGAAGALPRGQEQAEEMLDYVFTVGPAGRS
jgi:hypothetical protein